MPYHFGVKVLEGNRELKLTRENYAVVNNKNSLPKFSSIIYADEEGKTYSAKWCEKQLSDSLKNFDLNMEYFSCLDHAAFNKEIDRFLKKNKRFVPVSDLNTCDGKSGYYIMVLDEYCQVYIGTAVDITRRIRQHWAKNTPFDRLLLPMGNVNSSIMSVNSFRALDTTRIFAYITKETYDSEDKFINQFPAEYVCNRIAGGKITGGFVQAIQLMKQRHLK